MHANDSYKTFYKISFLHREEEWNLNFTLLMTLIYILSMTSTFQQILFDVFIIIFILF